jgi:Tfp pilus assembly protein PilP
LVADPDSPAVQQGQDPSLGATPAATQDIDMMLPVPKPPDDPEAREVYNAMETWHRALLSAYRVNLTKLPDPFMPIETVMRPPAQENTDPEARKRLPMIQRLALNSFTLTAIVVHPNPNNSTALVDSGGVGYLIRLGTKIGPNNGVVKEITDNKVVIEEPEVGYRGDTRSRLTELRLNPIDSGLPEDGILVDETA